MFKSLIGKEVEITYIIGGGSVNGTHKVKGIVTDINSIPPSGTAFLILDNNLFISYKYIISIQIL